VLLLSSISGLPESGATSTEEELSNGSVSVSNFGYNFSKYASTQLVKSYQLDGYSGYRSLLLGNIYGYNEKFKENSNVVATVIKVMHNAMNSSEKLELYGTGEDRRCFTHLSDLKAIVAKLNEFPSVSMEPIIVSDSRDTSIKVLANYVAESMDFPYEINFKQFESGTYTTKKVDNSNLLRSIGNYNFLDLKTGIDLTVKEYLRNQAIG
jgi:nucleoside-diphosphate-sugar epimerase